MCVAELTVEQARSVPCAVIKAMTETEVKISGNKRGICFRFSGPNEHVVGALKRFNSILFPVRYNDVVYKQCQLCGDVSQVAYINNEIVGASMCRLEASKGASSSGRLYIIALGVLGTLRSRGLGSLLVQRSLFFARCCGDIVEAYLHVQTDNDAAIKFYQGLGFEVRERLDGYYSQSRGVTGSLDAFVLVRDLQTTWTVS